MPSPVSSDWPSQTKIQILHLHAYKCAGTTFAGILERNFPGRVGYLESKDPGRRLPWQAASSSLDSAEYVAVSSHLITAPPQGNDFARMSVTFVRDPATRLASAFRYGRTRPDLQTPRTFEQFLNESAHTDMANFQTRHLSAQDDAFLAGSTGWNLRPESIQLDRADLFVGVVERFDESMVVLESLLEERGLNFSGAYPNRENVSGEAMPYVGTIPPQLLDCDQLLFESANKQLDLQLERIPDVDRRLDALLANSDRLRELGVQTKIPDQSKWRYFD